MFSEFDMSCNFFKLICNLDFFKFVPISSYEFVKIAYFSCYFKHNLRNFPLISMYFFKKKYDM